MQFFYHPDLGQSVFELPSDEAKHCVKALRKKVGDTIMVTDGKGRLATAQLIDASPAHCVAQIISVEEDFGKRPHSFHLAIAPTKNADRIEWMVEKCIEMGIERISFIICEHSERPKIDTERLKRIAISAMKQSNTCYIPAMEVLTFADFLQQSKTLQVDRYMAWCDDNNEEEYAQQPLNGRDVLLLIGPEGDFSEKEIASARAAGYKEVKLGKRRLRTETAGLYGCCVYAAMQK